MHLRLGTLLHHLLLGLAVAAIGGAIARGFTVFQIAIYCLLVSAALALALLITAVHGDRGLRPR